MKLFVLLFLVGCAAASPLYDIFEDAADEVYQDFMSGMEEAPALKHALGLRDEHHSSADETENDIKTELGKRLRETLDDILEKMKEAIDHGKVVKEDLQTKMQEIKEKMKEMKIDLGGRAKELLQKIKQKSKDFLKKILDTLGLKDDLRRSVFDEDVSRMDLNLKDMFKNLKKKILSNIDKEKVKEYVEKLFGKTSEMTHSIEKIINEKGDKYKQVLIDLIDRFLGTKDADIVQYSLAEYWEKIKDYFKDMHIDLKEKYAKFGEWVKEVVSKGLDKSKTKMENIKSIAREFVEHAKGVRKEIAVEALEFLRPYKDDLGSLYEQVKETVKDILKKQD